MSSLQIALFKSYTHSHIKVCKHVFIAQSGIWISVCERVVCVCFNKFLLPFFVACWMPVTRPLLSCSPFLSFQSALRASGQSCAQCPWFLDNQPEKSCSPLAHSPHLCAARAALICTTASCICLPLCHSRCSCLFIQRLALRLSWTEKQSRSGEFQCIQLGYWVDGCFGGAGLTVFSCGKHKHTVGHSVLVVQTHTNRLSHFSFFLPANFLHLLFFPSSSFLYFLEPTIYFL